EMMMRKRTGGAEERRTGGREDWRTGTFVLCVLLVVAPLGTAWAQAPAADAPASTQPHVEHLAAPALEGRATGSPGADRAAEYLAQQLKAIGAQPLPGRQD